MFSKQKRLSGRDITRLFKDGKTSGTPFFVVRHLEEGTVTRFAVISPKTIAKTAVLRSSSRRKWYASLRDALKNKAILPGMYALVLKKEALSLSPGERKEKLTVFLSKLK